MTPTNPGAKAGGLGLRGAPPASVTVEARPLGRFAPVHGLHATPAEPVSTSAETTGARGCSPIGGLHAPGVLPQRRKAGDHHGLPCFTPHDPTLH